MHYSRSPQLKIGSNHDIIASELYQARLVCFYLTYKSTGWPARPVDGTDGSVGTVDVRHFSTTVSVGVLAVAPSSLSLLYAPKSPCYRIGHLEL